MWPVPLAKSFNGEPGADAVGGGREVKVSRDYFGRYFGPSERVLAGQIGNTSVGGSCGTVRVMVGICYSRRHRRANSFRRFYAATRHE